MTISVGIFYEKKQDFSQEKGVGGLSCVQRYASGTDVPSGMADGVSVGLLLRKGSGDVYKRQDIYRKVLYLKHTEEKILMEIKNKTEKYIEINSGFRNLHIQFDFI